MEINESNFNEYFFNIRTHKHQPGQVIAVYTAAAHFVESEGKKEVINLLMGEDKALAAIQQMVKLYNAKEDSAYTLLKNMAQDLFWGMTPEEVNKKDYSYIVEFYYYTQYEYIPKDDPHWSCISLEML